MASGSGLQIVLGIPITIVNNDGIGGSQIDTNTTSFRTKNKNERIRFWITEPIDASLTLVAMYTTINSFVRITTTIKISHKNIQD